MKLNKIFAIALAALTMTACSDDDDYDVNSMGGVSVSMANASFTIGENVEYFDVPLQVTGETNGQVVVTLEVTEGPANPEDTNHPTEPAQEGTHFYVTSKVVRIPAGKSTFGIEVRNEWEQGFINDDRVFTIKIVSAEGATIGAQKDCVVTIANIDDAYTSMLGQWSFTGDYLFTGTNPQTTPLTFDIPSPDTEEYGNTLFAYGLRGRSECYLTFSFEFDDETQEVTMNLLTGTLASESVYNFGFGNTPAGNPIYGMPTTSSEYSSSGQLVFGDDIPTTVNAARNEISFDPNSELYLMIIGYDSGTGNFIMTNGGYWGGWYKMNIKKL